jgi:hypothetical protein
MDKLTVDRSLLEKLVKLNHGVELCDESGQTVGWFQPVAARLHYECPLSDEQLDQIEKQGGGRPLDDVLADLEKRA